MSLAFAVSKVFSHCMLAHALLRTLYILFDLIQSYPSTTMSCHGRIFTTSSRLLKNGKTSDLKKTKPKSQRAICADLGLIFLASSHQGNLVEVDGIEPTTPCLQSRCSPS